MPWHRTQPDVHVLQVLALRAPESGGGPFMITTRTFPEVVASLTKCAARPALRTCCLASSAPLPGCGYVYTAQSPLVPLYTK